MFLKMSEDSKILTLTKRQQEFANPCLSLEQLIAYAENSLPLQEKTEIKKHLNDCELCAEAVNGMATISEKQNIKHTINSINRNAHKRLANKSSISEKEFDIVKVKIDSLFKNQVINMRAGLMNRDNELYTSNAYKLYRQLIQLVEQKIADKNLIIIPDGILGYIPFEALLKEKAVNINFQRLHYLINDFQISYSFSDSLLFESHSNETRRVKNNFVGFAPVAFEQ